MVLTNRFYIFQNKKLVIQEELIFLKNKNEIILEKKIEDRTRQIQKAYNEVKNLSQEKELLLKEIYHRVKNNFHMTIGLLYMEKKSKRHPNKEYLEKIIFEIEKGYNNQYKYILFSSIY